MIYILAHRDGMQRNTWKTQLAWGRHYNFFFIWALAGWTISELAQACLRIAQTFLIKYKCLIATFMLHPSVERKAFYRQEAVLVGCKVGALHELEKRVFSHCLKTLNIRKEIR